MYRVPSASVNELKDGENKLMVLVNIDFWGTDDELKVFENALTSAVTKTQGAEFLGRYSPESQKWHYTYFCKADSLTVWDNVLKKLDYKRDKKLMSHESVEFYM